MALYQWKCVGKDIFQVGFISLTTFRQIKKKVAETKQQIG